VTHTVNQRQLSTSSPFVTASSPKKPNFYSVQVTDENNIFVDMSQGNIKPNNQPKERMIKAAKES